MTNELREEEMRDEEIGANPDLYGKLEWMKDRLGLETNEELLSKALSLLHQAIELEDRGYTVGAWKENTFSRDVIRYRIAQEN